jgi:hypothetical protein
MRTLTRRQIFFLAFVILVIGTFGGCTSIPQDNQARVYVAADGNVYMTDHLNRVYLVEDMNNIPEDAIVMFYRSPDARVYTKEKK